MLFFPNYVNNSPLTSPQSGNDDSNVFDSPTLDSYGPFSPISPVLDKFKDCNVDEKEMRRKNNNGSPMFSDMKYKDIDTLNGLLETLHTFIKSTYFDYFMDQYGDESLYNDDYNSSDNIKNSLEILESSLLDLLVLPLVKGNNTNNYNNKRESEITNSTKEFSHSNLSEENENEMDNFVENMKYMSSRENDYDVEEESDEYNNQNEDLDEEEEEEEVNENEKPKTKDEMKNELSCNALNILSVFFQYGNILII
ncbi:hypothetical protein PIROE2DRAFT_1821 [Piromyces sp. E2]|nr:hypothetical protein PIROE2DRAFT_1821 [Piromyces sp. E2]|eukprot:OUM70135.1 hypothetical protein PIROE2DRAFT_1821 [Piromyces sp. E2]